MDPKLRINSTSGSWPFGQRILDEPLWLAMLYRRAAISSDVTSHGGNCLIKLNRPIKRDEPEQHKAAEFLGLSKIRSCAVIDPTRHHHRKWAKTIDRFIQSATLDIWVPVGRYSLIDYKGGIFFSSEHHDMNEINFGVDAQSGSRFFESQDGEYLQLIPHDGDVAALVWTMGDISIYSLIEEVAKNYGEYTNRLCGMIEYSDGEIVALHSSKEALVRTSNQERPVRSLMVGFDDILIKLLSADQVSGSAPVDSEYDQVSIIGHRGDFLPVVDKWINITASPILGKNAVRIAELLG